MSTHIKVLGWLYIIGSAIMLVFGLLGGGLAAIGSLASGDAEAAAAGSIIGLLIGIFSVVFGLPGIVVGWGLLKRKGWARILAIILGILNLINFPFGTALGIYSLWVLFNDQAVAEFQGTYRPGY